MKFVFIVIGLSVLITRGSSYIDPNFLVLNTTHIADTYYSADTFANLQKAKFMTLAAKIVNKWLKCKKAFTVPYSESTGIFNYDVWSDKQHTSQAVKCLVDCTLRELSVIIDSGRLDEAEYVLQIKNLRFNYTLFDVDVLTMEDKQQIWETVYKEASDYPRNCYAAEPQGNTPFGHMIFGSLLGPVSPEKVDIKDDCYNLILSYAQAASKCKNVRDPKGDRCETSWMIVRCIMDENRKRSFLGPFYPIHLKEQ